MELLETTNGLSGAIAICRTLEQARYQSRSLKELVKAVTLMAAANARSRAVMKKQVG